MKVVLGSDVDGKELKDYIKNYLLAAKFDKYSHVAYALCLAYLFKF